MRTAKIFVPLGIALLLAGCGPQVSLHPLFTPKDLIFDPGLIGTWAPDRSTETLTFKQSRDNAYELTYVSDGVPSEFEAHLVRLGKYLFLDAYPKDPPLKSDVYKVHLIPAHTFARIRIEGDSLGLAFLDEEWLKDMVDRRRVKIRHERLEKGIILTASTRELQKLVLRYVEDAKAFPDEGKFSRQK